MSYADLDKLVKRIGRDAELADGLWKSGNHDARVLATRVADPAAMSAERLEAWAADLADHVLTDALSELVARTPDAAALASRWRDTGGEWVAAAGWTVVAVLAADPEEDDDAFRPLLAAIRDRIHAAPNRVRHAMNMALISLGGWRPELTAEAKAVAAAIGRVEVDHGATGCKTPDAAAYIDKMVARRSARRSRSA